MSMYVQDKFSLCCACPEWDLYYIADLENELDCSDMWEIIRHILTDGDKRKRAWDYLSSEDIDELYGTLTYEFDADEIMETIKEALDLDEPETCSTWEEFRKYEKELLGEENEEEEDDEEI